MSKVEARVTLSGSDEGIRGLIVTIYDARPGPPASHTGGAMPQDLDQTGTRLGSGTTEEGGRFCLEYDPRPICGADPLRGPDLILVISAPEFSSSVHNSRN